MTQENTQTKTKEELVRAMQREFTEIDSIMENIKELKEQAKESGHDSTMLAKLAKSLAEAKTDDIIEKNQLFMDLAEEIRGN